MGVSNKIGVIRNDAVVEHAARALAAGDPLAALNLVALRDDGPGLALRGIAMAQLGDLDRASALLKSAVRAFGPEAAVERARCVVAEAEIALAGRDLSRSAASLNVARAILERHGDRQNAAHARFIEVRRLLLTGHLSEAESMLERIDPEPFSPAFRAAYELVSAGIAVRRLRAKSARTALEAAWRAARHSGITALVAEIETARRRLDEPAARRLGRGGGLIRLDEVEDLIESGALIVDGCRRTVCRTGAAISLAGRPVLFEIARALGEAWPDDAPRNALIERVFEMLIDDDDDRLRLRVEVGRLRAALAPLADVVSTKRGYALVPRETHTVIVLAPPLEEEHAAVLAHLADGEAWSSSALALALSASQRTVQRALEALEKAGKVQAVGRGRACRWISTPVIGLTTTLLLPGSIGT